MLTMAAVQYLDVLIIACPQAERRRLQPPLPGPPRSPSVMIFLRGKAFAHEKRNEKDNAASLGGTEKETGLTRSVQIVWLVKVAIK